MHGFTIQKPIAWEDTTLKSSLSYKLWKHLKRDVTRLHHVTCQIHILGIHSAAAQVSAVSTFCDWIWQTRTKPSGWWAGFSCYPTTAQITLSSVKQCTSFSDTVCYYTLWSDTLSITQCTLCPRKCFFPIQNCMLYVLIRLFYSLKTGYFISSCNQTGVLQWQKNSDVHGGAINPNNHK